jgi:hypothetical protein
LHKIIFNPHLIFHQIQNLYIWSRARSCKFYHTKTQSKNAQLQSGEKLPLVPFFNDFEFNSCLEVKVESIYLFDNLPVFLKQPNPLREQKTLKCAVDFIYSRVAERFVIKKSNVEITCLNALIFVKINA